MREMHLLPALPTILLAIVTVWLVWPLLADPIARHLSNSQQSQGEDDAIRPWAELARPKAGLVRVERS